MSWHEHGLIGGKTTHLPNPIIVNDMVTNISIPLAFKVGNRAPAVNSFSGNDMFHAATDMHVCDDARAHLVYVALAVIANAKRAVNEAESGLGQDLAFVPVGKERYTNLAVTERAHKRVK